MIKVEDMPIFDAAIRACRVQCKSLSPTKDPTTGALLPPPENGCGGNWCEAQARLRKALEEMGVEWKSKAVPQ